MPSAELATDDSPLQSQAVLDKFLQMNLEDGEQDSSLDAILLGEADATKNWSALLVRTRSPFVKWYAV